MAQLQFSINSSNLGAVFSPPSTSCDWRLFYQTWNSGIETSAEICIVNQNIGSLGNDFMIDDISFAPVCYETDTIVVTTTAAPVITATPNDSICKGEISNIVASSANPNLTYTCNPGNITSSDLNVSPASSAFYNVKAVDENGCSSNLISRMVYVQASPAVNLQFSDTLCAGSEVLITANATGSNLTYAWSPNLSTINNLLDSPATSTSYSVIVTNAIGCSAYDTANVYVIPTLTTSISGDLLICEGASTVLTASGNQAGMDFVWSNGQIGNSITIPSTQAGSYFVTGSFYNCPAAEAEVTVVSQSIPQLTLPKDLMTCPGEPVSATVSSTTPGAIFNWLDLEETGDTKSITLLEGGFIYVTAQVGSCVSPIDSFYVGISANCFFDVPNVFTPNGDGVNDYFQLVDYSGISSLSCVILNRWGNVVASFDTPDFNWDGNDNHGNKLADGTYFYIIEAEDYAGQPFKEHGSIQLVR